MKVTELNYDNVKVTVYNPQSDRQREVLEKACENFIRAVEQSK